MASSETAICNSALIKLGVERINSLLEDNERASVCAEQYPKMRDEVLYDHPWNFAIKRAELPLLVSTPVYGFDQEFTLPLDCLRVLEIDGNIEFKIEGRKLLANDDVAKIKYISRITDVSLFTPKFDEALALRLASDLAWPLVQSRTLAEDMLKAYILWLKDGRSSDGQEGTPEDIVADEWLLARRSRVGADSGVE